MKSIVDAFPIHFLLGLGPGTMDALPGFWDEIPLSPSTTMPLKVEDDYWNGGFQRVYREVSLAEGAEMVSFADSITEGLDSSTSYRCYPE